MKERCVALGAENLARINRVVSEFIMGFAESGGPIDVYAGNPRGEATACSMTILGTPDIRWAVLVPFGGRASIMLTAAGKVILSGLHPESVGGGAPFGCDQRQRPPEPMSWPGDTRARRD